MKLTFTCEICGYVTISRESLRNHTQRAHTSVRYLCPDCQFKAKRKSYLTKHVRTQHKRELDKSCVETSSEPDMSANAETDQEDDMADRK